MSNTLFITVGNFARLDNPDDVNVVVLASDSYGNETLTFDDADHLLNCYPTQDDLITGILKLPAFYGAASFNAAGDTYELDAVSSVTVQGYPQ